MHLESYCLRKWRRTKTGFLLQAWCQMPSIWLSAVVSCHSLSLPCSSQRNLQMMHIHMGKPNFWGLTICVNLVGWRLKNQYNYNLCMGILSLIKYVHLLISNCTLGNSWQRAWHAILLFCFTSLSYWWLFDCLLEPCDLKTQDSI